MFTDDLTTSNTEMYRTFVLVALLASLSGTVSAQEPARFRTVPWAVWGSVGTNFDNITFSLAARRDVFGLGFGYIRNTEITVPDYSDGPAPATATAKTTYELQAVGADLYTMQRLMDWLGGYASIGIYVNINTLLVQDTTGDYYAATDNPDWTKPEVTFGAGLELQPLDWLLVGAGWHARRGVNVHLGISW